MYVTLFLLNLQMLITNAMFPCQMEDDHNESLSIRFSGTENDLNHILSTFEDSEDEIENFSATNYVAMTDIQTIFQNGQSDFAIATLNIQSINAKFDNLYAIVNNLYSFAHYFGAICLQETWLTSDADVTLFEIPGYKMIHQGSRYTRHGGLIIYLHENHCFQVRHLYNSSGIWEGLFIDVIGHNLRKQLTTGNIYSPPLTITITQMSKPSLTKCRQL